MKLEKLLRKTKKAAAGFTLIELMIVIAIIGILAAVAIPNFLKARDKAQFSRCVETLSGMKVAEEMYMTDWSEYSVDLPQIAPYMIAGCNVSDGTGCSAGVQDALDANCDNGDYDRTGSAFTFTLTGESKDQTACPICVTPAGYTPTNYKLCDQGWAQSCP